MRRSVRVLGAAVCAFGAATALAMAAPSNGNFETGNFEDWQTKDIEEDSQPLRAESKGVWQVYKGKLRISEEPLGPPRGGGSGLDPKLSEPPQGTYAAGIASRGPGTHILHREITVPNGKLLSLQLAYWNTASDFDSPNTLSADKPLNRRGGGGSAVPNQQLRIDLMKPGAPLKSVKDADIEQTIFHTQPGDDLKRDYGKLTAPVDAGKYRLRIAEVDNRSNFLVGVDAVRLTDD